MLADVLDRWEREGASLGILPEERITLFPMRKHQQTGQGIPEQSGKLAAAAPADEMRTGCPSFRGPVARVRHKTGKGLHCLREHYCNMDRASLFIPFYALLCETCANLH